MNQKGSRATRASNAWVCGVLPLVTAAIGAAGIVAAGVATSACERRTQSTASSVPNAAPPYPVGTPVSIDVPDDRPVLVVHAPAGEGRLVLYLHGKCSGPDHVGEWANVAKQRGTIVAPVADTECSTGGTQWTLDAATIHARLESAVRAVGAARREALDTQSQVLVGYSQGASRAEALAARYPDRYRHVVLVGGPTEPSPDSFRQAAAVVTIAGERDRHDLMIDGARALRTTGKPARFFELPGAAHGEFGPEGARVMNEALAFVREPDSSALD